MGNDGEVDKEWVEAEIRRIDERFKGTTIERDKAIQEFKESVTARFIQVNEFRGALDDLSKDMATRRELGAIERRLGELRDRINESRGGAERAKELIAYGFAAVTVAIAATAVIVTLLSQ